MERRWWFRPLGYAALGILGFQALSVGFAFVVGELWGDCSFIMVDAEDQGCNPAVYGSFLLLALSFTVGLPLLVGILAVLGIVTLWDRWSRSAPTTGELRPHVVWFGEMPLYMEAIHDALALCDLFVSIGTSGQVYPAAGFVRNARAAGAHCVEINLEATARSDWFHEHRTGPATEAVGAWVEEMLARVARPGF